MFPLSGRCARLRDLAVEKKPLGRRIAALHAMHWVLEACREENAGE